MKNTSCAHEDAVTAAARSGEWTPEFRPTATAAWPVPN